MAGYVMHCTLCKISYPIRTEWNDHLLTTFHQDKAKVDLSQWGEEERKCSILVYSSFALTALTAKCLIQYFSSKATTAIVTDAVLSACRNKMAILQFESRNKAEEVFAIVEGPTIKIEGQILQIKRLKKILELEWQELLQDFQNLTFLDYDYSSSPQKTDLNLKDHYRTFDPSKITPSAVLPNVIPTNGYVTIRGELQTIMEHLKIPDAEFSVVGETMSEIEKILEKSNSRKFKAELYRNNYLQLRNNLKSRQYLGFIYIPPGDNEVTFTAVNQEMIEPLKQCFTPHSTCNSVLANFSVQAGVNEHDTRIHLRHKELDIEIILSTCPLTLPEQRLSRLVAYYCKFDSRIKQLLSCVYYWAQVNDIHVAGDKDAVHWHQRGRAKESVPEPAGLEWILLFFLYHCEKLIPTPAEVLRRPHKIIMYSLQGKYDVGFSEDPLFALEWKAKHKQNYGQKEYVEGSEQESQSILRILRRFFTFYGETVSTPYVLLTSAGKMISPKHDREAIIRYQLTTPTEDGVSKIFVYHPLVPKWKLCVDCANWQNVVVPAMKITSQKLEKFINRWESHPDKCTLKKNSLKDVFCIQ